VGSSVNLTRRFNHYYSASYLLRTKRISIISNALLKYGYSNFKLEIIEYCDCNDLLAREQFYLDILFPEYNILKTAGSRLGRTHTEETKRKIGEAILGRKPSDETRQKMSEALLGNKLSEETKRKMSEARRGRNKIEGSGIPSQKIEVFDNEENQTTTYDSISEAARALDIRTSRISDFFTRNQKKPFKGRYIFTRIGK